MQKLWPVGIVLGIIGLSLAVQAQPDEWDSTDDVASTATDLGVPVVSIQDHGPHNLSADDLSDWFALTLAAGVDYEFYSSGASDTVAFLYSDDGETLLASDTESDIFTGDDVNFRIRFTPVESSTYRLRVAMFDPGSDGTYLLHYREVDTAGDEWDPADDVYQGATVLLPPTTTERSHGPHTLTASDTEDWLSIELEAGLEYEILASANSDTVADLYLSDGETRVAGNDSFGAFRILYKPEVSGTYLLRVRLFEGIEESIYTLFYHTGEGLIPEGDAWDMADDIFEGATFLSALSKVPAQHGPHTLSEIDRYDWFLFSLTGGATYQFESTGGENVIGDIYDADGITHLAPVDQFPTDTDFSLIFTPNQTGKYYLRVRHYYFQAADYTLVYSMLSDPPVPILDNWDSADDASTGATNLGEPSETIQTHGAHTLSLNDYSDWFRLSMQSGETYEFWSTGNSDTFAELYGADATDALVLRDDGGSGFNFRISFEAESTGIYYLRVRLFDIGSNGQYVLNYRHDVPASPDGDNWDPVDNTAAGATNLGAPSSTEATHGPHSLSSGDTEDWFVLQLKSGITYDLYSTGTSDTIGALFLEDGTSLVTEQDDGGEGRNFRILFTPQADRTYLLRVRSFGAESASYMLRYRGEPLTSGVEYWKAMR